jgi:hypothetical protein
MLAGILDLRLPTFGNGSNRTGAIPLAKTPQSERDKPTSPREFAITTPQTQMLDHSFTLQAIMELQKSVAELATKTDRLIRDVDGHGNKIDGVRHQISFVKGALWVLGGLIVVATSGVAVYLRFIAH